MSHRHQIGVYNTHGTDPGTHIRSVHNHDNAVASTHHHTGSPQNPPAGHHQHHHDNSNDGPAREGTTKIVVKRPGLVVTISTSDHPGHEHHPHPHHRSHSRLREAVAEVLCRHQHRILDEEYVFAATLQQLALADRCGAAWTESQRTVFSEEYARYRGGGVDGGCAQRGGCCGRGGS